MVQLSHPYMTTGKIVVLTMRTFVGKVMSLLFNVLSRFVICRPIGIDPQIQRAPENGFPKINEANRFPVMLQPLE